MSESIRLVPPAEVTIADVQEAVRAGLADLAAKGIGGAPFGLSVPGVIEALCVEATRDMPEIAAVWGRPADSVRDRREPGAMILQNFAEMQNEAEWEAQAGLGP